MLDGSDTASLARMSAPEIAEALRKITEYSNRIEESYSYWKEVRESLKKEVNLHNLSIKTLIQLSKNTKKGK